MSVGQSDGISSKTPTGVKSHRYTLIQGPPLNQTHIKLVRWQVVKYFYGVGVGVPLLAKLNDGISGDGCEAQIQEVYKVLCSPSTLRLVDARINCDIVVRKRNREVSRRSLVVRLQPWSVYELTVNVQLHEAALTPAQMLCEQSRNYCWAASCQTFRRPSSSGSSSWFWGKSLTTVVRDMDLRMHTSARARRGIYH